MAPSIESLSKYLCYRSTKGSMKLTTDETATVDEEEAIVPWTGQYLPWNKPTCLTVVCYVVKFCSNLENCLLSQAITRLDGLAEEFHHLLYRIFDGESVCDEMNETAEMFCEEFVNSFIPMVQKLFSVPKLNQLSDQDKDLKRNEIIAGFVDFLLQILNREANVNLEEEERYAIMRKELMFIITFLGDRPFQCTDELHKVQVNAVLQEFEMLANKVGSFIYSCVFSTCPVKASWFYEGTNALRQGVELLNFKIKQHCIDFLQLSVRVTLRSDVVDSFFIVNSFIEDLENMMDGRFKFTENVGIKDRIEALHEELMLSKKIFKVISVTPQEPLLEIRDLAYEAEYLVNSYVVGNIPVWYLNIRVPAIIEKIALARMRFEQLNEMHKTQLTRGCRGEVSAQPMDANQFVYVKDSSTKILNDLIGKPKSHRQTISIYGMPGLGKTTMASKLYNCLSVCDYFDRRAWCVVSQTYNVKELMVQILTGVAHETNKDAISKMKVADLGDGIHKSLFGRRYLIVIDDVWDPNAWYDLERYLPNNGNGSRVILTSRIKDAAPNGSIFHTLPLLSTDQCWDLLKKKVYTNESCPSHFLNSGKRIAAKCGGIPLAVVITAGILVSLEKDVSEWEKVEKQFDNFLLDDQSHYRMILELSYKHLPHNIKPCFLFLAAFPEDAEISVKKLIRWWNAQGFIQKEEEKIRKDEEKSQNDEDNDEKSIEKIAESYLLDLVNRSLLSTSKKGSDGSIKTCRIHDLLLDMCIRKAGEKNFLNLKSNESGLSIYQKHHHLCVSSTLPAYSRPLGLHSRSFIGRLSNEWSCFQAMPLLKVMDVYETGYHGREFGTFNLPFHLRYLGSHEMPEIMSSNLVNLEFLCVTTWDKVYVPSVILRMAKLKHLLIKTNAVFEKGCDSVEEVNLRSLSLVYVVTGKDEDILRHSPHLRKLKCICGGKITFPDLSFLINLESLKMIFEISLHDNISPNFNFPSTIKKLSLSGKLHWKIMSVIGRLTNLNVLKLKGSWSVGEVWETKDGEFEELMFLKIEHNYLRQWISCSEHFPRLEHLVLNNCWKLLEIPNDLGYIATMQTIQVRNSEKEASLSAVMIEEEQNEIGNEELHVMITSDEWTKEELALECRKRNEAKTTE